MQNLTKPIEEINGRIIKTQLTGLCCQTYPYDPCENISKQNTMYPNIIYPNAIFPNNMSINPVQC